MSRRGGTALRFSRRPRRAAALAPYTRRTQSPAPVGASPPPSSPPSTCARRRQTCNPRRHVDRVALHAGEAGPRLPPILAQQERRLAGRRALPQPAGRPSEAGLKARQVSVQRGGEFAGEHARRLVAAAVGSCGGRTAEWDRAVGARGADAAVAAHLGLDHPVRCGGGVHPLTEGHDPLAEAGGGGVWEVEGEGIDVDEEYRDLAGCMHLYSDRTPRDSARGVITTDCRLLTDRVTVSSMATCWWSCSDAELCSFLSHSNRQLSLACCTPFLQGWNQLKRYIWHTVDQHFPDHLNICNKLFHGFSPSSLLARIVIILFL